MDLFVFIFLIPVTEVGNPVLRKAYYDSSPMIFKKVRTQMNEKDLHAL